MRKRLLLSLCVLCSGCMAPPPLPPKTPLQIREMQTREYQTNDTRMVMKAVLNVLQDEGFVTKNAVTDLGLITATKEIDRDRSSDAVFRSMMMGPDAVWEKTEVIEATANVSEFGPTTRVRVSFQRKILDNRGGTMEVREIHEADYYQQFLLKVDKGVFIQKQRI